MRIDELDNNQYELYKKTDTIPQELINDVPNLIDESNLDEIYDDYTKLERENILNIKKTEFMSMASKLSDELDKINKYPYIQSEINKYESSQVYIFITALTYFVLMFYFRSIFVLLTIPIMLYIFDKLNLI